MAESRISSEAGSIFPDEAADQNEDCATAGTLKHPLAAAMIVGGALAAGAGAFFGTRALAKRNASEDGKLNSVMATAITASDVSHKTEPID